jgi:hypothetical protein
MKREGALAEVTPKADEGGFVQTQHLRNLIRFGEVLQEGDFHEKKNNKDR